MTGKGGYGNHFWLVFGLQEKNDVESWMFLQTTFSDETDRSVTRLLS